MCEDSSWIDRKFWQLLFKRFLNFLFSFFTLLTFLFISERWLHLRIKVNGELIDWLTSCFRRSALDRHPLVRCRSQQLLLMLRMMLCVQLATRLKRNAVENHRRLDKQSSTFAVERCLLVWRCHTVSSSEVQSRRQETAVIAIPCRARRVSTGMKQIGGWCEAGRDARPVVSGGVSSPAKLVPTARPRLAEMVPGFDRLVAGFAARGRHCCKVLDPAGQGGLWSAVWEATTVADTTCIRRLIEAIRV